MASRAKSDEWSIEPRGHSGHDRTNCPSSASSHPLDGCDGREPGMLGGVKAPGFDIDGSPAIQA